jgi:pyruvate dehydrogenase E1 component
MGAVAPEAEAAHATLAGSGEGPGLLAVTSPDRLFEDWRARGPDSHIASLLEALTPGAPLVTVLDGHPATLSWMAGVHGHRNRPLGVDRFGQCGDLPSLYEEYGLDADSICAAFREA